jgi:hypothetical protein
MAEMHGWLLPLASRTLQHIQQRWEQILHFNLLPTPPSTTRLRRLPSPRLPACPALPQKWHAKIRDALQEVERSDQIEVKAEEDQKQQRQEQRDTAAAADAAAATAAAGKEAAGGS